jgi:hypothetical protein
MEHVAGSDEDHVDEVGAPRPTSEVDAPRPTSKVLDRVGMAVRLVLVGGMMIGVPVLALLQIFGVIAPVPDYSDVDVEYASGDEPDRFKNTCNVVPCPPIIHVSWELRAGSSVSTTFRPETTDTRQRVASLGGRLEGPAADSDGEGDGACREARFVWTFEADGQRLGRGTIDASRPDYDLDQIQMPTRRTARSLVFTARRIDEADCEARLFWQQPGYHSR